MREGISLRAVSRALGYSVSALHEHRRNGAFTALSDGSYDLEAVKKGLLTYTIPSPMHRVRLEAKPVAGIARDRTPLGEISVQYVPLALDYDNDDPEEHI